MYKALLITLMGVGLALAASPAQHAQSTAKRMISLNTKSQREYAKYQAKFKDLQIQYDAYVQAAATVAGVDTSKSDFNSVSGTFAPKPPKPVGEPTK